MATVTNFVIVPLSFLSGTFYTIDRLPGFLQTISEFNPFFYMIDGFRYSFIGKADGSITIGLIYLIILSFVTWFITYLLYKKGYKIVIMSNQKTHEFYMSRCIEIANKAKGRTYPNPNVGCVIVHNKKIIFS